MAALVEEAKDGFVSAGGRNGLEVELAPGLPWVMADRGRIGRVLGNLVSNAARRSPCGHTIHLAQRRVSMDGSDVALTPTEYAVLAELAMHAGRTLAHDHLLQRVWSPGRRGERWLLREVVKRLRSKLGDDAENPAYIFTVPRTGYRPGEGGDGGSGGFADRGARAGLSPSP